MCVLTHTPLNTRTVKISHSVGDFGKNNSASDLFVPSSGVTSGTLGRGGVSPTVLNLSPTDLRYSEATEEDTRGLSRNGRTSTHWRGSPGRTGRVSRSRWGSETSTTAYSGRGKS